MAKNKSRIRQAKAARKNKKEKARTARRRQYAGAVNRAIDASGTSRSQIRNAPLVGAWVAENIFEAGLGHVIVARQLPDGRWAAGSFLLDVYCLGVKNAFLTLRPEREIRQEFLPRISQVHPLTEIEPAYARKLIDGAIDYARELGFEPHGDYHTAQLVLAQIDASTCGETFTFGKDGKPFFVNGPNISIEKSWQIIHHLGKICGPDGFHYMLGVDELNDDALDEEWGSDDEEEEEAEQ